MTISDRATLSKGELAEECLRTYFSSLGSFVLRGVPVREGLVDVTDIDLWVYTRATAHSRHVAIVDIKNKRRGKAFERAIWVKGLQSMLGADEAIIASKGVSDVVQKLSERLTVRVISGSVFNAIIKRYADKGNRLSTYELNEIWKNTTIDKTNLKTRIDLTKSEISRKIDFRALNTWLDEGAELIKLAVERESNPGPITRAAYLCCALIAVGADFLGRDHSLTDTAFRRDFFCEGMLFGRHDFDARRAYLDFTENAVTEFLDSSGSSAAQIRTGFEKAIEMLPIQGLAEFFARPHSSSELLISAIALEEACHAKNVVNPRELPSIEAKKFIGLISDYAGLKRRDVLGTNGETRPDGSSSTLELDL